MVLRPPPLPSRAPVSSRPNQLIPPNVRGAYDMAPGQPRQLTDQLQGSGGLSDQLRGGGTVSDTERAYGVSLHKGGPVVRPIANKGHRRIA